MATIHYSLFTIHYLPMLLPQFLIASPSSGSGKTTLSGGLMRLFREHGLRVQPFKCGPDYIDTRFHARACGRPSINLDRFFASDVHLRRLYAGYARGSDVCVVEGMMGMYDGYRRDLGSSADVAARLGLPVVLVVDARSSAYSLAPLLAGFVGFRRDVEVAGVIFNRVGSDRHYALLQEVCQDLGLVCFGRFPQCEAMSVPSRYLGLDFSQGQGEDEAHEWAALIDRYVDWRLLLQRVSRPMPDYQPPAYESSPSPSHLHICMALNDESFSFVYQEHIDRLRQWGELTFINPEADEPVPERTDLLYLPGGYPEKHADALSSARRALASVRDYVGRGGRCLAECGGMIYLSQGVWLDGEADEPVFWPLAGVLPFGISARKVHRKLSLGYRRFDYGGQTLRGHEFHYSQFLPPEPAHALPPSMTQVYNAHDEPVPTPVFRHRNVIASYTHLYWGETDLMSLF